MIGKLILDLFFYGTLGCIVFGAITLGRAAFRKRSNTPHMPDCVNCGYPAASHVIGKCPTPNVPDHRTPVT
jgi:hypothetical protein